MDIRKIKKLIELLEDSSLSEIEIVEGEESVRRRAWLRFSKTCRLMSRLPPGRRRPPRQRP